MRSGQLPLPIKTAVPNVGQNNRARVSGQIPVHSLGIVVGPEKLHYSSIFYGGIA